MAAATGACKDDTWHQGIKPLQLTESLDAPYIIITIIIIFYSSGKLNFKNFTIY
jgi:hypothetical protein